MNKYQKLFAVTFAALSMSAFTSCSDNDDDPVGQSAAKEVAGTYNGIMTCSVMGGEDLFEDMTFIVTAATDESAVDVIIPEFGEMPMQVPSFTVEDVKVVGADGSYSFYPTKFSGNLSNGKTYSGTLDGSKDLGKLTLRFNLQYGAMPMPLICTFTSEK